MTTDAAASTAITDAAAGAEVLVEHRRFIRALLGNRKAMAGVVILLVMAFVAAFPGLIAPDDPRASLYLPNLGPSSAHLLGTTQLSQDVFSQLI